MNALKRIFNNKGSKIWAIITIVILPILLVINIVLLAVIPGVMDAVFGGDRGDVDGKGTSNYETTEDVTDKDTALIHARKTNLEICQESFTLLKNDNKVLPLTKGIKVSVFGKNSSNIAYGSSGSAGSTKKDCVSILDSLTSAGFSYNQELADFYSDNSKSGSGRPSSPSMSSNSIVTGFETGETPISSYPASLIDSFSDSQAALVVITRTSGENYDLPMTMMDSSGNKVSGAFSKDDHYLELDQNEQDMLRLACENFSDVVLVVNSASPLELGFLDSMNDNDSSIIDYDFSSKVKAAIWIGLPGENGMTALGEILKGDINPSGHLTDTYPRDFTSIPAAENFSCNGQVNSDSYLLNDENQSAYFIDYEEGIYTGYKYFETRGNSDGETWYQNNVVFPFGYGLSYTSFDWNITNKDSLEKSPVEKGKKITVDIEIENTGSVSGKEVVQLYSTLPYTNDEMEKSYKILLGYAKTGLLASKEKETVSISFDPYSLASYDYNDKNNNNFEGYELEKGNYTLQIASDSHTVKQEVTLQANSDIRFENDSKSNYKVENRFDSADDQLQTILSRKNWEGTYPSYRTSQEKAITSDFINKINSKDSHSPLNEESKVVVDSAKNRPAASSINTEEIKSNGILLVDVIGEEYSSEKWDTLISELTLKTMWNCLSKGAFNTSAIDYIGKPATIETDGPAGYVNFLNSTGQIYGTCFYCCEVNISSTWSHELAEAFGESIGNEGLMGYQKDGRAVPYSGIYAPGVNLHRTPFGGRNPEYYSEDPVLSGLMASDVIKGAKSKGVYMFLKHFAVNEQETHRGGLCTWVDEQALRENYLKPFEIAIKEGEGGAIMSSFNRLGSTWTGGDYPLMTEVLRNEWGFKGLAISDFASGQSHMDNKMMMYAGGDLWLDTLAPTSWFDSKNIVDVYVIQEAMKHTLYTISNSCAMNGLTRDSKVTSKMSYWRMTLLVSDCVLVTGLLVWGFIAVKGAFKKEKQSD